MLFGSYRQFHQECYTDALTSVDAVRYSTDMMTLATMATAQPEALLENNTTIAHEEEWVLLMLIHGQTHLIILHDIAQFHLRHLVKRYFMMLNAHASVARTLVLARCSRLFY